MTNKKEEFPTPISNAPELIDETTLSNKLPDEIFFLGRRSNFNDDMVNKMKTYLDTPLFEDIKDDDGKLVKRIPTEMPSLVGLALVLGVHRKTIHSWSRANDHFADYVELLKQKQKRWLLYHGLNKNVDSSFAKFVAINATDMVDKKEHAVTTEKIEINIDSSDAEL